MNQLIVLRVENNHDWTKGGCRLCWSCMRHCSTPISVKKARSTHFASSAHAAVHYIKMGRAALIFLHSPALVAHSHISVAGGVCASSQGRTIENAIERRNVGIGCIQIVMLPKRNRNHEDHTFSSPWWQSDWLNLRLGHRSTLHDMIHRLRSEKTGVIIIDKS